MNSIRKVILKLPQLIAIAIFLAIPANHVMAWQAEGQPQAGSAALVRKVGTVKTIAGTNLVMAADSGAAISVVVQDAASLRRLAPGQTDLKNAAAIQLGEIQVGDRILVRGSQSEDGKAVLASTIIVMKQSDIAEKRQHEQADWQQHGVGGLVSAVDAASGTFTVSAGIGTGKAIVVRSSKDTTLRRYAADSIRYDDAKPGTADQIKVGDQLRARGTFNADRSEMNAAEIVSGTFRNIAGTISSVDLKANSISVVDLSTKKPVTITLSPDSQLRKLPAVLAERVATRLKRTTARESGATEVRAETEEPGGHAGAQGGGQPDLQQILQRLPVTTLTDLNKGDAVMIVSTQGTDAEPPAVITLLSGVEPILTASPGNNGTALSAWNLASSIGDAASQ